MKQKKILVITPISHINGVKKTLDQIGNAIYLDDPSIDEVGQYRSV